MITSINLLFEQKQIKMSIYKVMHLIIYIQKLHVYSLCNHIHIQKEHQILN